ncbi:MAG: choice-of-anchor D domain-containing protein [Phycisphaera sp.]|nr:choice-of-anchor D domain-containing protein [Phycisphaera sp.]
MSTIGSHVFGFLQDQYRKVIDRQRRIQQLHRVCRDPRPSEAGAMFDPPEPLEDRLLLSGSISGTVWADLNGDGVRDAGEPGLAGVTVYLDDNDNAQLDWTDANGNDAWDEGEGERWVTSAVDDALTTDNDETGQYQFEGLNAGEYVVRQVTPEGYRQTQPDPYVTLPETKLTASDGQVSALFGFSLALNGDVAIIGAFGDNGAENDPSPYGNLYTGAAYIYRQSQGVWTQEIKLVAADGKGSDYFGTSVAIEDNVAVVGAQYRDNPAKGVNSGAVYVYRWNQTSWEFEALLLAADGSSSDLFGSSVSLSGDVIVVGAMNDSDTASYGGSAYVFRWNGSSWVQEAKLQPSDNLSGETFGCSIAISGDTVVVGAKGNDTDAQDAGVAYVYRHNGSSWIEEARLAAPDADIKDQFGQSVDVDAGVIVVGSHQGDELTPAGGSAYVYRWDGSAWLLDAKLTASNGDRSDAFGTGVAIENGVILIGAPSDNTFNGSDSGSAYEFAWDGSAWVEKTQYFASDGEMSDSFGHSVAINNGLRLISAHFDGSGAGIGSAYVIGPRLASQGIQLADSENIEGNDLGLKRPVSTPDLSNSDDTGIAGFDNITTKNNSNANNKLHLTISGTLPGDIVRLYARHDAQPTILMGQAVAAFDTVTITTDGSYALDDGQWDFTATIEDAHATWGPSQVLSVTIDTVAPVVTFTPVVTADTTPALAGTIDAGNRLLVITVDGKGYEAEINGNSWTIPDNTINALPLGSIDVVINAYDYAGNSIKTTYVGGLTIVSPPKLSIGNYTAYEGDSGETLFTFTVSIDKPAYDTIRLDWRPILAGWPYNQYRATPGTDYLDTVGGSLIWFAGQSQSYDVTVPVYGDTQAEHDEYFFVEIYRHPDYGTGTFDFSDRYGLGTIVNDDISPPPIAQDDQTTLSEDHTVSGPSVLLNDFDPVPGPSELTALLVDDVLHGSLTLNPDGTYTYTPDKDYNGTDHFTYRAYDGVSYSNLATYTFTIDHVNDLPGLVYTPPLSVLAGQSYTYTPVATDGDPEVEQSLSFELISGPANGEVTDFDPLTGRFTFVATLLGEVDHITLRITDDDTAGGPALSRDVIFNIFVYNPTPTPTGLDLLPGSDTGSSDIDNITNLNNSDADHSLVFRVDGTVVGALVEVVAEGVVIGSATATGTSTVVTTDGLHTLADGPRYLAARQTYLGYTSDTRQLFITLDTQSPTIQGISGLLSLTTKTPNLTVSTDLDADAVSVDIGGQTYAGNPGFSHDGKWYFNPSLWYDIYDVQVTAVDLAGNSSTRLFEDAINIYVAKPDLWVASDTGVSSTDNITSKASSLGFYVGTNYVDTTVEILDEQGRVLGSVTPNYHSSNLLVFTQAQPLLSDGQHEIRTRLSYGGRQAVSPTPLVIEVNSTPPTVEVSTQFRDVQEGIPRFNISYLVQGQGASLASLVQLDRDLNGDGDFEDPGEAAWLHHAVSNETGVSVIMNAFTVGLDEAPYGLRVRAYNFAGVEGASPTTYIVLEGATEGLIDDRNEGFLAEGNWGFSIEPGKYVGTDHTFARGGNGANRATYTFTGLALGNYEVYATWRADPNRATDIPYSILDGSHSLGIVRVNQEQPPSGLTLDGFNYSRIGGLWTTNSGSLVVAINDDADDYVDADAIYIRRVGALSYTPEIEVSVDGRDMPNNGELDFGTTNVGSPVQRTLTVLNKGAVTLNLGLPDPLADGFRVVTPFSSATLAPNTSTTLTVELTAGGVGDFSGLLGFETNDGDENPFRINLAGQVTNVPPPPVVQVIDDRDAGFTTSGTWGSSVEPGRYVGDDHSYAINGNGGNVANYTFTNLTPGVYKVYTTWRGDSNRASNTPYTVLDNGTTLGTVRVNQRYAPSGITSGGFNYSQVGSTWNITSSTLVVRLTDSGTDGYVDADAVRIERVGDLVSGPEIVVFDGANDIANNTGAVAFGSTPPGTSLTKTLTVKNIGNEVLTLGSLGTLPAGFSLVTGFGSTSIDPDQTTTFTLKLDALTEGVFAGPISFTTNDSDEATFTFSLTGKVEVAPPQPIVRIIDDRDAGFTTAGTWGFTVEPGRYYGNDHSYAINGHGANVASYTFTDLTPGQYRVYATWQGDTNRADNTPFAIYDGGEMVTEVRVNQRLQPAGVTEGNRPFNAIGGVVSITGSTLVVKIRDDATGYADADAVRIERVGDPVSGPEIVVLDGANDIADGSGTAAFGNTTVGLPITKTLTVKNVGNEVLTLGALDALPAGFELVSGFGSTSLAAGESTTFVIRMLADTAGGKAGVVRFASNDASESEFTFNVTGSVGFTPLVRTLDDRDAGFATVGQWGFTLEPGRYVGDDHSFARDGGGANVATYTFLNLPAGTYRISATWRADSNRATNTPYTVLDGSVVLDTIRINQEQSPNDLVYQGYSYEDIGTFTITSGTMVVRISDDANDYVDADAIRIERIA